jgi:hypothetical protein
MAAARLLHFFLTHGRICAVAKKVGYRELPWLAGNDRTTYWASAIALSQVNRRPNLERLFNGSVESSSALNIVCALTNAFCLFAQRML